MYQYVLKELVDPPLVDLIVHKKRNKNGKRSLFEFVSTETHILFDYVLHRETRTGRYYVMRVLREGRVVTKRNKSKACNEKRN